MEVNIYGYTNDKWLKLTDQDKTKVELKYLTRQLDSLTEDLPADLQKIIIINTKSLQPLGKLYGNATRDFKYKYGLRKFTHGSLLVNSGGTGIEKQGQAEVGSKQAREDEADAEGEMVRWKHAYDSTKELIQSQKLVLRAMITELENTNNIS